MPIPALFSPPCLLSDPSARRLPFAQSLKNCRPTGSRWFPGIESDSIILRNSSADGMPDCVLTLMIKVGVAEMSAALASWMFFLDFRIGDRLGFRSNRFFQLIMGFISNLDFLKFADTVGGWVHRPSPDAPPLCNPVLRFEKNFTQIKMGKKSPNCSNNMKLKEKIIKWFSAQILQNSFGTREPFHRIACHARTIIFANHDRVSDGDQNLDLPPMSQAQSAAARFPYGNVGAFDRVYFDFELIVGIPATDLVGYSSSAMPASAGDALIGFASVSPDPIHSGSR
jgi:hypothetical protein